MPTETTSDSALRFGMKSLLLATLNVSLFLGACMWAVRGPDMGTEQAFDAAAEALKDGNEEDLAIAAVIVMPLVFLAGVFALPIAMIRLGRPPYAAYHLFSFAAAAVMAVLWWAVGFGNTAPIAARFAVPLAAASVAMFVEVGYRKAPTPYWVLAGVGLLMAAAYALLYRGRVGERGEALKDSQTADQRRFVPIRTRVQRKSNTSAWRIEEPNN